MGFWAVVVMSLAQVFLLSGSLALEWLMFPVEVLAMLVGLVLYGAATLQAKVLPRLCGVAFILGLPVWMVVSLISGINGAVLGAMLFGMLWLALGYVL